MNPLRALELLARPHTATDMPPFVLAAVVVSALVAIATIRRLVSKTRPIDPSAKEAFVLPGTLPIFGNTFQVLKNKHRIYDWLTEQCAIAKGEPFQLRIIGRYTSIVVAKPMLVEDVQKLQFEAFEKGPLMRDIFCDLLGGGIFAADGANWIHQRKTASHLFTMRGLREAMTHTVHDLLPKMHQHLSSAIATQQPIDLVSLFSRFTLEAFVDIGFGVRLGCLDDLSKDRPFQVAFDGAQKLIAHRVLTPPVVWKLKRMLNIGSEKQLHDHMRVIDDQVLSIIASSLEQHRRHDTNTASKTTNLVTLFLNQADIDGGSDFDPIFLRDVVLNFLMAGRDTTASLLSWFFYRMSLHPDIATKIVQELRTALPHAATNNIFTPSMDEVSGLTYLEAAVRETMRVHPPVPSDSRIANRDTVLRDGTFIRQGASVSFPNYLLGRQTSLWGEDALEFKPERWFDPENPTKLRIISPYQFNAFLAGPRVCLGMNLAMVEAKIVIASLLNSFHTTVLHPETVLPDFSITLSMKNPLQAMPARRRVV